MPHPRTLARTLVAALAATALAATAAHARPLQEPSFPRATERTTQATTAPDLRSPDARDAASPAHPDRSAAPRGTSVNPGQEPYSATGAQTSADDNAALAQERYYSSYGDPRPISSPAAAPVADTGHGIAPLPFILGVAGALLVGLAAGIGLHQLHTRRRHATLAA